MNKSPRLAVFVLFLLAVSLIYPTYGALSNINLRATINGQLDTAAIKTQMSFNPYWTGHESAFFLEWRNNTDNKDYYLIAEWGNDWTETIIPYPAAPFVNSSLADDYRYTNSYGKDCVANDCLTSIDRATGVITCGGLDNSGSLIDNRALFQYQFWNSSGVYKEVSINNEAHIYGIKCGQSNNYDGVFNVTVDMPVFDLQKSYYNAATKQLAFYYPMISSTPSAWLKADFRFKISRDDTGTVMSVARNITDSGGAWESPNEGFAMAVNGNGTRGFYFVVTPPTGQNWRNDISYSITEGNYYESKSDADFNGDSGREILLFLNPRGCYNVDFVAACESPYNATSQVNYILSEATPVNYDLTEKVIYDGHTFYFREPAVIEERGPPITRIGSMMAILLNPAKKSMELITLVLIAVGLVLVMLSIGFIIKKGGSNN